MNYEDNTLKCEDCGPSSTPNADDGSFHDNKARRSKRYGSDGQSQRDMYPWYTPIVVKTPPSVVTAPSTEAIASTSGTRPRDQAGRGQ